FGSGQERKVFPLHQATDRLGIQQPAIRGAPLLGPGCHLSQESSSLKGSWANKPLSKRGYVIGARTGPRTAPAPQSMTPSPADYQPCWGKERKHQPVPVPFAMKAPRFADQAAVKGGFPGPGAYEAKWQPPRKVTWPMKFGSPDWPSVPMPAKMMLHTEEQKLKADKELRKHRNRVAYLSLYYS
ncbi:PIFO protein, partial [Rhinopomastus cyanomelas]|nr:PIFO protein [Rhinopomastus cyanomelas]